MSSESKHAQPDAEIDQLRDQIDQIDGELLTLLSRRALAGLRIGEIKHAAGLPVYVPERERAVLQRLIERNPGPLSGQAVEAIFSAIIAHVRGLEQEDATDEARSRRGEHSPL